MNLGDKIQCQACVGHGDDAGCYRCGGYRYIAEVHACPSCGTRYWARPHAYTTYDGKKWTSFDGLEITDRFPGPSTCARCEK